MFFEFERRSFLVLRIPRRLLTRGSGSTAELGNIPPKVGEVFLTTHE
jgi:hypothetical protein